MEIDLLIDQFVLIAHDIGRMSAIKLNAEDQLYERKQRNNRWNFKLGLLDNYLFNTFII